MKPTFLLIGAAKSGTTSLWHQLQTHPTVFVSPRKELHFFSFDEVWNKGVDWYEAWFEGAGSALALGEASTTYSVRKVFPRAAERIADYAPQMKLIYIARDPFRRMESLWLQLRRLGSSPFREVGVAGVPQAMRVDLSFDKALRRQADVLVESSNYWREINAYRRSFADDQILVLLLEDLQRDPRSVVRRCFEFLGVDPDVELPASSVKMNAMTEYRLVHGVRWRILSSPRLSRIYSAAAAPAPALARAMSRRFFRPERATTRPRWQPETREWVWDRLREDTRRFLDFYGYPQDRWELPSPVDDESEEPHSTAQGGHT